MRNVLLSLILVVVVVPGSYVVVSLFPLLFKSLQFFTLAHGAVASTPVETGIHLLSINFVTAPTPMVAPSFRSTNRPMRGNTL